VIWKNISQGNEMHTIVVDVKVTSNCKYVERQRVKMYHSCHLHLICIPRMQCDEMQEVGKVKCTNISFCASDCLSSSNTKRK
jgi:hypothetical protein